MSVGVFSFSQHLESTAQLITSSMDLVSKTGMTPEKRKLPELDLVMAENSRLAKENKELAGRLSTVEWSL